MNETLREARARGQAWFEECMRLPARSHEVEPSTRHYLDSPEWPPDYVREEARGHVVAIGEDRSFAAHLLAIPADALDAEVRAAAQAELGRDHALTLAPHANAADLLRAAGRAHVLGGCPDLVATERDSQPCAIVLRRAVPTQIEPMKADIEERE